MLPSTGNFSAVQLPNQDSKALDITSSTGDFPSSNSGAWYPGVPSKKALVLTGVSLLAINALAGHQHISWLHVQVQHLPLVAVDKSSRHPEKKENKFVNCFETFSTWAATSKSQSLLKCFSLLSTRRWWRFLFPTYSMMMMACLCSPPYTANTFTTFSWPRARKHLEMWWFLKADKKLVHSPHWVRLTFQGLLPPCCRLRLHHLHSHLDNRGDPLWNNALWPNNF